MTSSTRSPADVYDEDFVPALFEQWGPLVADAARVGTGQRALDVGCGTGALTFILADRVGSNGSIVGLDPSDDMLSVARRKRPDIQWHRGRAEALPFPDAAFDSVVSQFGLMFFDNRVAALREMMRVLRPGGRLAVAVCDSLDHSPGYSVFAELLHRLFGPETAQAFRAPFSCGDRDLLRAWCADAGIEDAAVTRRDGAVRFPSIEAMVSTERACAWTLGGLLDTNQFDRLRLAAEESLAPFEDEEGCLSFAMPSLLVTATRP